MAMQNESLPSLLSVQSMLLKVSDDPNMALNAHQRQSLRDSIDRICSYHAKVGVLGKTGAGKSALCNALFGKEVTPVSDVEPGTHCPQQVALAVKEGKGITLIDMPGVGESEAKDAEYRALYQQWLPQLDLVLWVIKGDDRALGVDERFFQQVLLPSMWASQLPLLVVVNQCDKVEPCREWDWKKNHPGPQQQRNIDSKLDWVCRGFRLSRQQVCAVSAEENYGLVVLLERIVESLPTEKKWGLAREAKQEYVSEATWHDVILCAWETVRREAGLLLQDAWVLIRLELDRMLDRWIRRR